MPSSSSLAIASFVERFHKAADNRDLRVYWPIIEKIVFHFADRGAYIETKNSDNKPSITMYGPDKSAPPMFIIATNGEKFPISAKDSRLLSKADQKYYAEVYYSFLGKNPLFSGDNFHRLQKLANRLAKIDGVTSVISEAKGRPSIYIARLLETEGLRIFLSAFDTIFDHIQMNAKNIELYDETKPTKAENLARAWDILTKRASNDTLENAQITYEDFRNEVLDREPQERVKGSGASHYLYPIQELCQSNRLPPLTGLVVGVNSRLPSSGYAGSDVLPYELEMQSVLNYNWAKESNPWRHADGSVFDQKEAVNKLLRDDRKALRWAEAPVRQYQVVFRKALLEAYDYKCAVCGIDTEAVLDAAHIKPYIQSTADEEAHITNGILLCKNHHASYDAKLWWIDENYKIEKAAAFATTQLGRRTTHFTLPEQSHHHPGLDFIQYHNAQIKD